MAIRHREVFPVGSSPDSIAWDVWNDDHVGVAGGITQDQQDALDAANAPTTGNPFATMADVGIQTARVQLTDAQIKTLAASPVTLIPNPGAGFRIVPTLLHVVLDTRLGAYAVGSEGSEMAMSWSDEDGNGLNIPVIVDPAFMEASALNGATYVPFIASTGLLTPFFSSSTDLALRPEVALVIGNYAFSADLPNSEWTGGNAANTLSVYVEYRVLPTTPFA